MLRILIIIVGICSGVLFADIVPPICKNDLSIPYSLDMLLNNINGSVLVEVYLDEFGSIDSISLKESLKGFVDSLVIEKTRSCKFEPAYENGIAVPSVFNLEFTFSKNDSLRNPNLYKTFSFLITDSITGMPIANAEIECRLRNEFVNKNDSIYINSLLDRLSVFPYQHRKEDRIVVVTDKNGFANLYGIRNKEFDISIHHSNYKNTEPGVSDSIQQVLNIALNEKGNFANEAGMEMLVVGRRDKYKDMLSVEDELDQNGLTDDLNKIVSGKSSVVATSQSASRILMNGGGLYDNEYILNGISIFSPTHFPFYSNLDKNGLILSDLVGVNIETSRLGGRYNNSSGGVVSVNTDKNVPEYIKNRSMGYFDLSYEKVSFKLTQIGRKGKDQYQIAYSMGQKALMKNYTGAGKHLKSSADYGYSDPLGFYDVQLKTFHHFKKGIVNTFGWIGVDQYYGNKYYSGKNCPVGLGTISLAGNKSDNRLKVTIGGSNQYHDEGKRVGINSPLKEIKRKSAAIIIDKGGIKLGKFTISDILKFEYVDWDFSVKNRIGPNNVILITDVGNSFNFLTNSLRLNNSLEHFLWGVDINAGTRFVKESCFIDPGVWCLFPFFNGDVSVSTGIISNFPDVRGGPDEDYSNTIFKSYIASTRLRLPVGEYLKFTIEPYLKYFSNLPKLSIDPLNMRWDESSDSEAYLRGLNIDIDIKLPKCFSFSAAGSISKGDRYEKGKNMPYEWEIPWQLKGAMHLFWLNERLNLFLKPVYTSGVPYYDYAENGSVKKGEESFTLDVIIEYHVNDLKNTPIDLMEAYIGLRNVSFTRNGSEIYWAEDMTPLSYNLTPMQLTFGAKASVSKVWRKDK